MTITLLHDLYIDWYNINLDNLNTLFIRNKTLEVYTFRQSSLFSSLLDIFVILWKIYVRLDSGVSFRYSSTRRIHVWCRWCFSRWCVKVFIGDAGAGTREILVVWYTDRRGLYHGIESNRLTSRTLQGMRQWEVEISHQKSNVVAFTGDHGVLSIAHIHIMVDSHNLVDDRLGNAS